LALVDKAPITNGSRSRWLFVAGFFALLGIAASQPGPSTPPPTLGERTLPDGTVLSFERLTVEHRQPLQ